MGEYQIYFGIISKKAKLYHSNRGDIKLTRVDFTVFRKIVFIILILLSSLSAYHTVAVNINSDELEVETNFDLAQFSKKFSINRYFAGADYLYVEKDSGQSTEKEYLFSLNFMMKNRLRKAQAITFGLGGKFLSTKVKDRDAMAVPLGLYMNFAIPFKYIPISLSTQFFYSPKPLTFGDGVKYFEQRYELIFEIIKMGEIFIGYRELTLDEDTKLGGRSLGISKLPYIGLRFGF